MKLQRFVEYTALQLGGGALVAIGMLCEDAMRFVFIGVGLLPLALGAHLERRMASAGEPPKWLAISILGALLLAMLAINAFGGVDAVVARNVTVIGWLVFVALGWWSAKRRWKRP